MRKRYQDILTDAMALCPFYSSCSKLAICCEGMIRGTRVSQRFPSEEARNRHVDRFCCAQWKRCVHARNLLLSYEMEGHDNET